MKKKVSRLRRARRTRAKIRELGGAPVFKAAGDVLTARCDLNTFKPQEVSNIVWAYAILGESHPNLFKKIGNHIARLDNLDEFAPQALSNTIWAFATAGVAHPKLSKEPSNKRMRFVYRLKHSFIPRKIQQWNSLQHLFLNG